MIAQLVLLVSFILLSNAVIIKHVYFDPTTSMTKQRRDGVVIVELSTGEKSTICNEDFTTNDATVICRMLGYNSNGDNSFALISSKSSYRNTQIFFSNLSCDGDESTIANCANFDYKLANQSCQSHENDVHVYCNNSKVVSRYFASINESTCNRNVAEIKHGNDKMGLMILKSDNMSFTLCGMNNNFGENEAQLFCKMLCFQNVKFARIISNFQVKGASIGGFRNMKCPSNSSSLSDCSNVYSDDSELCTPADNIGVACESQSFLPEPKPKIICNGDYMTLEWKGTVFPDIESANVNIIDYGRNCTHVNKQTMNGVVSLTVKLDRCNPTVSGNKDHILFRYSVQRIFPRKNKIVIRNTQNFDATCFIARKEVVGNVDINLENEYLNDVGNRMIPKIKIELSTNFDFTDILKLPYSQKIGTIIYGKVTLLNAPAQIQLVLQKCYLYNAANDIEVLIDDKCSVRNDVKINPINNNVIKFNYKSFAIQMESLPLFIKCETTKCEKSEISCSSSCQRP